ncbi:hypothetical protein [Caulobacter sp. DWR3-1-2]|uniref:hypothetical protein n=1 Tax=Caulobacter sp. DWR3-1-2 TaxID=2804647 RepID=UPI003CF76490
MLQDLYKADPLVGPSFARGLETEAMAQAADPAQSRADPDLDRRPRPEHDVAGRHDPATAGHCQPAAGPRRRPQARLHLGRLHEAGGGPRIAALSPDGWDTHAGQIGQLYWMA